MTTANEKSVIRVVLADDHEMYRKAIENELADPQSGIEVVAHVDNGERLVEAYQTHRPDVVVTDVRMPTVDGIEATRRIRGEDPDAKILVVSGHEDPQTVLNAMVAGASGFAFKTETPDGQTWISLIRRVAGGETVLWGSTSRPLIEAAAQPKNVTRPLSEREREILALVRDGKRNKEIAVELGLKIHTVKDHLDNIYQKLGTNSRSAAVAAAIRLGQIDG